MRRRTYLALVGTSSVAGCLDGAFRSTDGDGTSDGQEAAPGTLNAQGPTSTEEPSTQTTTTTTQPGPPVIEAMNLISSFEAFGDVLSNATSSVSVGEPALIGYRGLVWGHDGDVEGQGRIVDAGVQVNVYDPNDDHIASKAHSLDDRLYDEAKKRFEDGRVFGTAGWTPGTYRYDVIIRDSVTGEEAKATSSFQVSEPEPSVPSVSLSATDATPSDPYTTLDVRYNGRAQRSVNPLWVDGSIEAEEGSKYLVVRMEVRNVGDPSIVGHPEYFVAVVDGTEYPYLLPEGAYNPFLGETVSPGDPYDCWTVYRIPEHATAAHLAVDQQLYHQPNEVQFTEDPGITVGVY